MAPEGWSPSIQNPESSTGNLIRESYKFHIFITFHFEYLVRYILSICICFNIVQTVLIYKMNIISSGTQSTIATIIDTTQLILLVLAKSGRFCHIFFRSCRYHPSYGFSAFFSGFQNNVSTDRIRFQGKAHTVKTMISLLNLANNVDVNSLVLA